MEAACFAFFWGWFIGIWGGLYSTELFYELYHTHFLKK